MKRNALFLVMIFFATSLFAKKVEVDKAAKVAQSHVYGNAQLRSAQDEGIKLVYTATGDPSLRSSGNQGGAVYYYVFNVKENDGFVIVSGDDIAIPVLGYSANGTYDAQHLPPAFSYWMECLQKEIEYGIQQHTPQSAETKQKWDAYLQGTASALHYAAAGNAPLIETKWAQGAPFNNSCPEIGGQTLTGCVATAMAQVMKYYEWPEQRGTGALPGYTTSTSQYTITGINLDTQPAYDWDNMLNSYSGVPSPIEQQAVATLMYHCGVSVEMDYGVSASGAFSNNIGKVLPIYFGYDKSIQSKPRVSYTDDQWHAILKAEIDASRPVIYSGRDGSQGGHAFICDGYKSDNTFHFNWGWGGYADEGYFVTNALDPDIYEFNLDHSIIINIMPDEGGAKIYEMKLIAGESFTPSMHVVSKGEMFTVSIPLENAGVTDFSGTIYIALVDDSENVLCYIGNHTSIDLEAGSLFGGPYYPSATCVIPSTVNSGKYNIRAYAQAKDETTRTPVKMPIGTGDDSYITVNVIPLDDFSLLTFANSGAKAFDITTGEPKTGESINVSFSVGNAGAGDFFGTFRLGLYKDDVLVQ
ncbi:MAG: C10 family peptidase, partial [Tannerellaceae bacterium]|nr:C10 family peptidase [Tannerellaceae bacterium]